MHWNIMTKGERHLSRNDPRWDNLPVSAPTSPYFRYPFVEIRPARVGENTKRVDRPSCGTCYRIKEVDMATGFF